MNSNLFFANKFHSSYNIVQLVCAAFILYINDMQVQPNLLPYFQTSLNVMASTSDLESDALLLCHQAAENNCVNKYL